MGPSPAFGEASSVEVGLEAGELEGPLLDDAFPEQGSGFHHKIIL